MSTTRSDLSAPHAMLELTQGSVVTQALYVAAELRIADLLASGPRPAAELAVQAGADPDAVYRLLRLLASQGVFTESTAGTFALTPVGQMLRSDSPQSMRDLAVLMGHPTSWEDWGHLVDSVRTGEPNLPKLRGMHAFEFMTANPDYGMAFGQGMGNLSGLETEPVLAAYDFTRFGTVVDFGGGRGALLAAILVQAGSARGILVDGRAEMMGAGALLAKAGLTERVTIESSGLFDPAPAGGDAYVLKHIVHDWPEEQSLEILRNVRKVINPGGRLLLMEFIPPAGDIPHPAKVFDLWLLLLVGGKERTPEQYAELLAEAGFALEQVLATDSAVSIIEARPS